MKTIKIEGYTCANSRKEILDADKVIYDDIHIWICDKHTHKDCQENLKECMYANGNYKKCRKATLTLKW